MEVAKLEFNQLSSMESAIKSNQHLKQTILQTARNYHTIDVNQAMTNLVNVGDLLKLAYAGSKGFNCCNSSNMTIELLIKNYQSYIKNSYVAASSFVAVCLIALKQHKQALLLAEEDLVKSLNQLEKCASLATGMAKDFEKLVQEAKNLCDLSRKALIDAQGDESVLKKNHFIEEKKKEQLEVSKKADQQRTREFQLQLISSILKPISSISSVVGNTLNTVGNIVGKKSSKDKQANKENTVTIENESDKTGIVDETKENVSKSTATASLDEKEMKIMEIKADLQKKEREANAELAKIGVLLKDAKTNDNDLMASIHSLELAIKALGKIKTTFEHTRQFWMGVEKHCRALTDMDMLNGCVEYKDLFIDKIKESGLNWLTLGQINYTAQMSIKDADEKADNIMCNLPTKSEAIEIVKNQTNAILLSLQAETSAL